MTIRSEIRSLNVKYEALRLEYLSVAGSGKIQTAADVDAFVHCYIDWNGYKSGGKREAQAMVSCLRDMLHSQLCAVTSLPQTDESIAWGEFLNIRHEIVDREYANRRIAEIVG